MIIQQNSKTQELRVQVSLLEYKGSLDSNWNNITINYELPPLSEEIIDSILFEMEAIFYCLYIAKI